MPQQQRLPFTRRQATAQDLANTTLDVVSLAPNTPNDDEVIEVLRPASAPPNASQLRRKRRAPSQAQQKLRTSWVYNHMPDEDKETRYFTEDSILEWR